MEASTKCKHGIGAGCGSIRLCQQCLKEIWDGRMIIRPVAGYRVHFCEHVSVCGEVAIPKQSVRLIRCLLDCHVCKKQWVYEMVDFFDAEPRQNNI